MKVEDELKSYLLVLWRYKWTIISCAAITFIVALVISLIITPKYKTTATLRVASTPGGASDYTYIGSLTRLINTYVEIASSDISLDEVARRLGLSEPPKVEVDVVPETELIQISNSNADPALSRDISNTLAAIIVEQSFQLYGGDVPTAREILAQQLEQSHADLEAAIKEYESALLKARPSVTQDVPGTPVPNPDLETLSHLVYVRQQIYGELLQRYETAQTNEELRMNAITVAEPATIPEKPDSPKVVLNSALGLFAGLILGAILAFIFEGLDDTVREVEDVQEITQLPILCVIPDLKTKNGTGAGMTVSPNGALSTVPAFDQLRTRLPLQPVKPKCIKLLITSPEPGTGKSTVASNLAISLTKSGKKVILMDMDFRRPRQHTILGLQNREGLSDFMRGEMSIEEILKTTSVEELRVITAGSIQYDPFEWFIPSKMSNLFEKLSKECDYLVIDTPALLSVADPLVLASQVDVLILVVARYTTERRNLRFTLHQLNDLNAKITGIVVNRMPNTSLYSYYSWGNEARKSRFDLSRFIKNIQNHK